MNSKEVGDYMRYEAEAIAAGAISFTEHQEREMRQAELETIETRLAEIRDQEAETRTRCWHKFDQLMQPNRAWMERVRERRVSTTHEDERYRQQLNTAYDRAMNGLGALSPLANEAAKLRTRRANLLYSVRKQAA